MTSLLCKGVYVDGDYILLFNVPTMKNQNFSPFHPFPPPLLMAYPSFL